MEESTPQVAGDVIQPKTEDSSSFNLKWLVSTVLAIWPWLLGSVIVALIIGNLYLRYATPIFRSSAELLIIDSKKGSSSGDDIAKVLGLNNNSINIENEIEVLRSRTTMMKVVRTLHLNIEYSIVGRFKTTNVFANKPFEFIVADSSDGYYSCKVDNMTSQGFRLVEETGKVINGKWGDTMSLVLGKVVMKRAFANEPPKLQFTINVSPIEEQARGYMGAVDMSTPSKNATYITLSMQDNIPERSVAIMNELMHIYMTTNVDNRNRMSDSTINFIDRRLLAVQKDLTNVEEDIVNYKQQNQIADMGAQSVRLISANAGTQEKLQSADMELQIIGAISDYLQNNKEGPITLPASLMANAGLAELLSKLNATQNQIENNLISLTEDNPVIITLRKQKAKLKNDILTSLVSSKKEV
jgi:uncharacterized protein involved in exopolysaccharide biosynthesis